MKKINNNKFFIVILLLFTNLLTFCFTYKFKEKIYCYKNSICNNESFMHDNANKINDLEKIDNTSQFWYNKYQFISHAGGGIDGKTYTNSKEAWDLSYQNGNRVFDADLMFTSDGYLVLRHENINLELDDTLVKNSVIDYDENGSFKYQYEIGNLTYNEYMNKKIYDKYTPIDLEFLLNYLDSHTDLYISIDMKDDLKKSYEVLYNTANAMNKNDVLSRIIVSIYNEEEYKLVKSIYNFDNYIIRQYINKPNNYYNLAKFMIDNNIGVITVSKKYIEDSEIQMLQNLGIKVFVAIVDFKSDYEFYKRLGVDGCVTNWLYEKDY